MKRKTHSENYFQQACKVIPGGVNSPVRAFKAVGEHPLFIDSGYRSRIFDVDGNEYLDYVCSWGPLILGHRHPKVLEELTECLEQRGTSFGAPIDLETVMARMIYAAFPSIDMVRLVNSGTEATMTALRLARAYTGRSLILKFEGCYHGHADSLLVKAGSGAMTLGVPSSPGVLAETAAGTLTAAYNDLSGVKKIFADRGKDIAAVIVEPLAANMGVVPPEPGFLEGLREVTAEYGALLIFDEVISGFRVTWGGMQNILDIKPDLTCLGKVIGGGLPVGAYGGKKEIMELVAPLGPVYQAGTLSGNPLAMSAGLATLRELQNTKPYRQLNEKGQMLAQGLREAARQAGVKVTVNQYGSLLTCFFTDQPVTDYNSALRADTRQFKVFFQAMLEEGIYLPPSQYEALFISTVHSEEDLEQTIKAAERAFSQVKDK